MTITHNIPAALALSDGMEIAFFVISGVITVVSLILGILAKSIASKYDRLQDRLEKKAESEIDQRFKVLEAQVMGRIDKLVSELESAQRRLGAGDRLFKAMQDRDHQLDMKTLQALEALRRDVIENMATKTEVEQLRQGQHAIEQQVASIKGAA